MRPGRPSRIFLRSAPFPHRGFLTGDGRRRNGNLVHGKDRLPGVTIEHERQAHLRELHDDVTRGSARRRDRDEDRRRRVVVVPDVVTHRLVVPLALTGPGVEGDHAVREKIRPFPEAAVEVLGGRAGRRKDPAASLVDRDAAPRVGAAVALALDELPRFVTELSRAAESCGRSTAVGRSRCRRRECVPATRRSFH